MTLAAIIRAQLADGRPLRVTRALLEALEEPAAGDDRAWAIAISSALDGGDTSGAEFFSSRDEMAAAVAGLRAEIVAARSEHNAERAQANEWLAQKHDAECERDEAKRNARAWADERAQARLERDEARAEVERLRVELEVERSLECDASAVIREAEERGARWALTGAWAPDGCRDEYVAWLRARAAEIEGAR